MSTIAGTVEAASEFDRGIALEQRHDEPSVLDADVGGGWQVSKGINGGFLLAVAANALRSTCAPAGHPDPLSISAHYLSPARPGPAVLRTDLARTGRSMSTGSVSLLQDKDGAETERIRATGTYGDLDSLPDEVRTTATPPELPAPEECVAWSARFFDNSGESALLERLDLRLDEESTAWIDGTPSGRGRMQGWLRMADGREPDPLLLLLALDVLPPVTLDLGLGGWTPTLELTAHVRAKPAPGWLRLTHATRNFAGGLLEEDAEVWDSAGRLVAQSRQLASAPRPAQSS
ncbi:acyl-CoA thioesterase [Halopolyspora algeriensis]|uniref:Acyl-CoA thioesterase n=1 Tax=Halopolyspora algeriensis TaxID=1500506 RepID=A0A368W1M7_9ACTN|nr:thioesterase family protein [Halopolyspora algeriensis]RCW45898.1 acyl-CoA thioesterase [Halopolyspora algeriensis]TQM55312.1 acyl-CoA thioesterase [Halopolyspora algeriensis]